MYIYRALNDNDIKIDPIKNGLYSKKMIEIHGFDIKNLEMYAMINNNSVLKMAEDININHDKNALIIFDDKMNELKQHLTLGSVNNYDWISFSKNKYCINRYYNSQPLHRVAVMDSNISNYFDGNLFCCDACEENFKVMDVDYTHVEYRDVSPNWLGNIFIDGNQEVVYYNHVPEDRILCVLDQFFFELLCNNALDENVFYKNSDTFRKYIINNLKNKLRDGQNGLLSAFILIYENDSFLDNWTEDELIGIKCEILKYLEPNEKLGVKPFNKEKIYLPELYKNS